MLQIEVIKSLGTSSDQLLGTGGTRKGRRGRGGTKSAWVPSPSQGTSNYFQMNFGACWHMARLSSNTGQMLADAHDGDCIPV